MSTYPSRDRFHVPRRVFLQATAGALAAGPILAGQPAAASVLAPISRRPKHCVIKCAFVFPPTESLRQVGYYSWPGSGFDAEGRRRAYSARMTQLEQSLGIAISTYGAALDDEASAVAFAEEVRHSRPDGLLLILLKKGHWPRVKHIVETTNVPAVVYAPLGVLLVEHINEARQTAGLHLITSEEFDSVEPGLRMVRAGAWMRQSRILNIDGAETKTEVVPHIGTEVLTIPHERFYAQYRETALDDATRALASAYSRGAKEIVEPNEQDVLDAAKCYFALRSLIDAEQVDAIMMNCLPGLQHPRKHVPPCMAFMSLRDQGFPAGCQSDLSATLTLLLVQYLFERPGFQQNASMDTAQNLYFGAHCTCPSHMNGPGARPEPYVLRSHAEAGWGCVPRVLLTKGQEATIAQYLTGDTPKMYVYTGSIVGCPESVGGCRTNVQMTINEVDDVRDVKGMHQIIFYGNCGRPLREFCRLHGIEAVS
ncbi:MAG: hypothetical protein HUU46_00840 [Candidatus Hydrogenedentes bacterium]|nr:hypothetical protein [Candidatus Hydrogenedentota bacterium]